MDHLFSFISLQDLLLLNLDQVQAYLTSIHSLDGAENNIERYYEATRGIYTIIHIIDEALQHHSLIFSTEQSLHLANLRRILYAAHQSRLSVLSDI